jgi:hypothetical protein
MEENETVDAGDSFFTTLKIVENVLYRAKLPLKKIPGFQIHIDVVGIIVLTTQYFQQRHLRFSFLFVGILLNGFAVVRVGVGQQFFRWLFRITG